MTAWQKVWPVTLRRCDCCRKRAVWTSESGWQVCEKHKVLTDLGQLLIEGWND